MELVIFVHQGELSYIAPREHWELIGWLPAGDYRLTATVYTGTVVGEWSERAARKLDFAVIPEPGVQAMVGVAVAIAARHRVRRVC